MWTENYIYIFQIQSVLKFKAFCFMKQRNHVIRVSTFYCSWYVFIFPPCLLCPLQLLQLWRSGSPCQGVWPAPPAKEMPLLPEHHAHGGSVSPQGAGAYHRLSGPTRVYLGLQPGDRDLPLPPRGGGALRLVSPGGLLLLPRGAPHAWPPDPEMEEILKTAHRGEPITTNPWPSCLPLIKDTWSPPSSTSHLWKNGSS